MLAYLYSKFNFRGFLKGDGSFTKTKTEIPYIDYHDRCYIEEIAKNAEEKSKRRIDNIISNISKLKFGSMKKYQVKGYHEAKQIMKYCEEQKNLNTELIWHEEFKMNKLESIQPSIDTCGCCNECGNKRCFCNIKVPCMYVIVKKTS